MRPLAFMVTVSLLVTACASQPTPTPVPTATTSPFPILLVEGEAPPLNPAGCNDELCVSFGSAALDQGNTLHIVLVYSDSEGEALGQDDIPAVYWDKYYKEDNVLVYHASGTRLAAGSYLCPELMKDDAGAPRWVLNIWDSYLAEHAAAGELFRLIVVDPAFQQDFIVPDRAVWPTATPVPTPRRSSDKWGVYIGMPADDVLARRGKGLQVRTVGEDANGLIVEWIYDDATYTFRMRTGSDGIECYRVTAMEHR